MKEALIAIIVALATLVNTSALKWWARVLAALAAAAVAVAVSLLCSGCMSTTTIEGKSYSWRMDILAPIGATVAQHQSTTTTTQPNKTPA